MPTGRYMFRVRYESLKGGFALRFEKKDELYLDVAEVEELPENKVRYYNSIKIPARLCEYEAFADVGNIIHGMEDCPQMTFDDLRLIKAFPQDVLKEIKEKLEKPTTGF